jgi:O-antigen/teichoic acid export membrane protein
MKKSSLRGRTLLVLIGTGAQAFSQWLTVIFLSHFGGAHDVGEYGFALAICGPIFVFAFMGLRQVLTIDHELRYSFAAYLCNRNLNAFAASAVALVAGALMRRDVLPIVAAIVLSKIIEANIDIFHGIEQRAERYDALAVSRGMSGLLGALLFCIAFWKTKSVTAAALALCLGTAISFVVFDLRVHHVYLREPATRLGWREISAALQMSIQREMLWLALPLAWAAVLISLRTNIPRYAIESSIGIRELGAFVSIGYLITVFTLVVAALGRSAMPRLAQLAREARWDGYRALTHKLLLVASGVGVVAVLSAWVFSYPAVRLVYGREVAEYHYLLRYIMVVAWMSAYCSVLHHCLEAVHLYKTHLVISAVSTGLCFLTCWLFLRLGGGLVGAALGWAVALLVQALWSYRALQAMWKVRATAH